MRIASSLVFAAALVGAPLAGRTPPRATSAVVHVAGGDLRGIVVGDGATIAFKGIPYAAPPTGPRRWRPPEPAPVWTGQRDAGAFGPACPQGASRSHPGQANATMLLQSEDCLYLNIWKPARTASRPLPVFVWIYGGAFVGGSSSLPVYDGAALAAAGAIVVTLNYRVGMLGYLAHPALTAESPRHASGNYGLLDQIAALSWIQSNIAAFGGDPGQVTIAGHSAGAVSVSLLLASPLARGLFARGIVQSGPIEGLSPPTRTLAAAETIGAAIMRANGVDTLAAMRDLPVADILAAKGLDMAKTGPLLGPIVDGYSLVEQPADTYLAGREAPVPLIIGTATGESGSMATIAPTPQSFAAFGRAVFREEADRILLLYPHATEAQARASQSSVLTERILAGTLAQAACHARVAPTWVYRWDHAPPLPDASWRRAYHGSELPYLFGTLSEGDVAYVARDRVMSGNLMREWLSFVRDARPADPSWRRFAGPSTMHRFGLASDSVTPVPASDRLALFFTPGDPRTRPFGPPPVPAGPCAASLRP